MDAENKDSTIKCTLCGAVFVPKEQNMCDGCPLSKTCKLICCPNCGFRIPAESKLTGWVKHRLEKQGRD